MKKLRITVNGVSYDVDVEVVEDDDAGGASYGFPSVMPATPATPATPAAPRKSTSPKSTPVKGGAKTLTSPLAGTIVEIKVQSGASVQENQPLVVIEAMKMNTNISSPVSGKIKDIMVKAGDNVQQEQILLTFE